MKNRKIGLLALVGTGVIASTANVQAALDPVINTALTTASTTMVEYVGLAAAIAIGVFTAFLGLTVIKRAFKTFLH